MLNQTVIVGRIVSDPKLNQNEEGKESALITLAVQRSYKNQNGEYDTDFVPVLLWNGIATNAVEYCRKGDLVGAKGRVQSNGEKIEIVAEKITFLSSKKEEQ